jgi:hypothetical protein
MSFTWAVYWKHWRLGLTVWGHTLEVELGPFRLFGVW